MSPPAMSTLQPTPEGGSECLAFCPCAAACLTASQVSTAVWQQLRRGRNAWVLFHTFVIVKCCGSSLPRWVFLSPGRTAALPTML